MLDLKFKEAPSSSESTQPLSHLLSEVFSSVINQKAFLIIKEFLSQHDLSDLGCFLERQMKSTRGNPKNAADLICFIMKSLASEGGYSDLKIKPKKGTLVNWLRRAFVS